MFADGTNHAVKVNDAQLLGLEEEEDLKATMKRVLNELWFFFRCKMRKSLKSLDENFLLSLCA
jgi:hypothetical protein